jgi:predicted transcriptional regulator of viral defense system
MSGAARQACLMRPDPTARLVELAQPQHGWLTTAQARAAGLSRYAVDAAVAAGRVTRQGGLLAVPTATPDDVWRVRVHAAQLRAGRDAVVGGETAARLHGIAGAPAVAEIQILVPENRHPESRPGVRVRRSDVDPADRTCVDGIAVTAPLRTLVDCARRSDHVVAVCLLESAIRQSLVTVDEVKSRLDELRPRTNGVAAARWALARIDLRSESPLETVARLLLLDNGFAYPELQLPFQTPALTGRIDLAYPAILLGVQDGHYSGLAIETDGREPHLRDAMFHHDRVRQTALEEERFLVRRLTDPQLRQQPAYVVTTVRRAMARIRSVNGPLTDPVAGSRVG